MFLKIYPINKPDTFIMLFLRIIRESFLFAFDALRVNKLRTILSLSGVTIGIFLIISVFTVVDTLENNIRNSVEKLGDDVIYVQKWPWQFGGEYPWWKYYQRPVLTINDQEQITERTHTVEAASFVLFIGNETLKYQTNSVEGVTLTCGTHSFDKVRTLEFQDGRYFSPLESATGANVAIIGNTIAEGLFGNVAPIGKRITLRGRRVTVIGLLKKEGDDPFDNTTDEWVLIPVNFARNLVSIRNGNFEPQIWVKGKENIPMSEVQTELTGALRSIRKLSPAEEENFSLNRMDIVANQMESLFKIINTAGWIIGLFSILVGGFGIANIMFVSVKERTNQIGIQKSLGAKNYFILNQFLVESVTLCLLGGIAGLLLVFILAMVFSGITGMEIMLTAGNIIKGIVISVLIGVISGYWPAYSAARLDPVEAIRSGM